MLLRAQAFLLKNGFAFHAEKETRQPRLSDDAMIYHEDDNSA
jgi:hypothetical protein